MEMKQELQGKLVDILTSIQTAAGKASDFAMEQLPDIAQSYVAYGRAWSLVEVVLGVLTIGALILGTRRLYLIMERENVLEASPLLVFPYIGVVLAVIWSVLAAKGAVLVWFAPKVWLLKEIANLLK